ncbi:MAG TPA: SMC-Scp complex subunit ScpB [Candidatus Paceibacterota bacterium]|nr:SMC-Scp complex subunit ScpB [Candidatus Paceibacterota bacterium]
MALALSARLEAVLFASGEPLEKKRLAALLGVPSSELDEAATELESQLASRGLSLVATDAQFELRTHPEAAEAVKALRESELSRDLGKASLETLAMILYKGGATRGEIDFVRGVNSTAALRSLLMRGLIERTEDASDRRRARYLPTVEALAHLGVGKQEELPRYAEFSAALAEQEAKSAIADA